MCLNVAAAATPGVAREPMAESRDRLHDRREPAVCGLHRVQIATEDAEYRRQVIGGPFALQVRFRQPETASRDEPPVEAVLSDGDAGTQSIRSGSADKSPVTSVVEDDSPVLQATELAEHELPSESGGDAGRSLAICWRLQRELSGGDRFRFGSRCGAHCFEVLSGELGRLCFTNCGSDVRFGL